MIRPAERTDVPTLVVLMREFYAESAFPLPAAPASRAFAALLGDTRLGGVWLAEVDGAPAGHVVLATRFSMEYGGLCGVIDDLYVRPAVRGRGVGAALLAAARAAAGARGLRALRLEVGAENGAARRLYVRAGYADEGHRVMSLALAPPIHDA